MFSSAKDKRIYGPKGKKVETSLDYNLQTHLENLGLIRN